MCNVQCVYVHLSSILYIIYCLECYNYVAWRHMSSYLFCTVWIAIADHSELIQCRCGDHDGRDSMSNQSYACIVCPRLGEVGDIHTRLINDTWQQVRGQEWTGWREGVGESGRDGERNEGGRENGRERKEMEGREGEEREGEAQFSWNNRLNLSANCLHSFDHPVDKVYLHMYPRQLFPQLHVHLCKAALHLTWFHGRVVIVHLHDPHTGGTGTAEWQTDVSREIKCLFDEERWTRNFEGTQ